MRHCDRLDGTGWKLYYDDALFPPSTDSFLLSAFPRLRPGLRVCDLGCGSGLLGLLSLRREPALQITGLDINREALALAEQNARENGLSDRLCFRLCDLRRIEELPAANSFDLILCNPPYFPPGTGVETADPTRRSARFEASCQLEDVARAAARLVRWGGGLCLVHRPDRLTDLCCILRGAGLEPKRLRLVQDTILRPPSLLLLEARRGGRPGLTIAPPLLLRTPDGRPTPELDAIYYRQTEEMS